MTASERDRRIENLARLARTMDASIRLPGGFRLGVDAIVGLVPLIGDAIGFAVSAWIVLEAHALGLPMRKIAVMSVNVAVDAAIGLVPLAGDLFDAAFKANLRNVEIIRAHFGEDIRFETAKDVTPRARDSYA